MAQAKAKALPKASWAQARARSSQPKIMPSSVGQGQPPISRKVMSCASDVIELWTSGWCASSEAGRKTWKMHHALWQKLLLLMINLWPWAGHLPQSSSMRFWLQQTTTSRVRWSAYTYQRQKLTCFWNVFWSLFEGLQKTMKPGHEKTPKGHLSHKGIETLEVDTFLKSFLVTFWRPQKNHEAQPRKNTKRAPEPQKHRNARS